MAIDVRRPRSGDSLFNFCRSTVRPKTQQIDFGMFEITDQRLVGTRCWRSNQVDPPAEKQTTNTQLCLCSFPVPAEARRALFLRSAKNCFSYQFADCRGRVGMLRGARFVDHVAFTAGPVRSCGYGGDPLSGRILAALVAVLDQSLKMLEARVGWQINGQIGERTFARLLYLKRVHPRP